MISGRSKLARRLMLVMLGVCAGSLVLLLAFYGASESEAVELSAAVSSDLRASIGDASILESNSRLGQSFLYRNSEYILELSNTSHQTLIDPRGRPSVVVYYATWCPHCRHFVPIYEAAVQAVKAGGLDLSEMHFAALNCVQFHSLCGAFKIGAYPTIKAYNFQAPGAKNLRINAASDENKDKSKLGENIKSSKDSIVKYILERKSSFSRPSRTSSSAISVGSSELASSPEGPGGVAVSTNALEAFVEHSMYSKSRRSGPGDRLNDALSSLHAIIDSENAEIISLAKLEAVVGLLRALRSLLPQEIATTYESLYKQLDALNCSMSGKFSTSYEQEKISAETQLKAEYSVIVRRFTSSHKRDHRICGRSVVAGEERDSGTGFTCGLWQLFHYMTVAGLYQSDISASQVLSVIRTTVDQLFGCLECRNHFLAAFDSCEFGNCHITIKTSPVVAFEQAVIWLWRLHNAVTVRILRETAEGGGQMGPEVAEALVKKANVSKYDIIWPNKAECDSCAVTFKDGRINSSSGTGNAALLAYLKKHYFDANTWSLSLPLAASASPIGLVRGLLEGEMTVESEGLLGRDLRDHSWIAASAALLVVLRLVSVYCNKHTKST